MPYKTILCVVQGQGDIDRVLDCAAALGQKHGAHVVGLHAEAMPVVLSEVGGFPDVELMRATSDANRERSKQLEAQFTARLEEAGLSNEWRALESFGGDSAASAVASARSADIVVAAQQDPDGGSARSDIDALLYDAGRPVLVLPFGGPPLQTCRKALVAWNGSREAARAVFDALPLLAEAESVEVLVIDPPDDPAPERGMAGAGIAAALARHDIPVTVGAERSGKLSADELIRNKVAETGVDLLVMGAYSHSWLSQLLFGGVTRSVLDTTEVATLLSR